MKDLARIILLFLWLFAITAPSIITLMDVTQSVTLTNVNEEEQQEFGKKSQAEEKMVKDNTFKFSLQTLHDQQCLRHGLSGRIYLTRFRCLKS